MDKKILVISAVTQFVAIISYIGLLGMVVGAFFISSEEGKIPPSMYILVLTFAFLCHVISYYLKLKNPEESKIALEILTKPNVKYKIIVLFVFLLFVAFIFSLKYL